MGVKRIICTKGITKESMEIDEYKTSDSRSLFKIKDMFKENCSFRYPKFDTIEIETSSYRIHK